MQSALALRRQVACHMRQHPDTVVAELATVAQWVEADTGETVTEYTDRMAKKGWGGAVECAVLARMRNCQVSIYVTQPREVKEASGRLEDGTPFARIACFGNNECATACHVRFVGGNHYDAIVWQGVEQAPSQDTPTESSRWKPEAHGIWKKQAASESACDSVATRHRFDLVRVEEDTGISKRVLDQQPVVGREPNECKRRRIRGKCKGF